MPYPGSRILTITLTIVVIVAHPSCGFTLHRKTTVEENPGPTTDLASQESLHVNSIKRSNDIRQDKDADRNKATKNKNRLNSEIDIFNPTEAPNFYETGEAESSIDTGGLTGDITAQDDMTTDIDEQKVTGTYSISEATTQEINSPATNKLTSSESTATSDRQSLKNQTENSKKSTVSSETSLIKTIKQIETEQLHTKSENKKSTTSENKKENVGKNTITVPIVTDQIAIDSEPNENLLAQKEPFKSTSTSAIRGYENNETYTENSLQTLITPILFTEINEKLKIFSLDTTTVSSSHGDFIITKLKSSELPDDLSKSASTIDEVIVTKDSSLITTEPTWKKYATIERNRTESSNETSLSIEKENDSDKAESIPTTLSKPSLDMLREDLMINANHLSTVREPHKESLTSKTEIMPMTKSIESTQLETLGTVASKRAGFLDLSKRTSASYAITSTDKNIDDRTMYDTEEKEAEPQELKKIKGYESQSQLAEDAIKEELMKEEIINNHEENAKRLEDELKSFVENKSAESTTSHVTTENFLSVQPLSQDRRTTLYTVGPNYKPMKRIEVQPAKPFVRDPDDNSWRNESISSLGIVFKPKNSSSKSFKAVLKTKTETELNNLQDKDGRQGTPELRERLEKITEVRKSKKKRVNKLGEVVYTDYEEGGSAEGTVTPKAEIIPTGEPYSSESPSTLTPITPDHTESTSPMTTGKEQRYWRKKLEMISREELFKDLGLDILTTQKPKKPYSLAEYYDTTDEYDADYLTLPKVDLKKFTVPFKSTPPMLPPSTRIIPPQFPERKPTVQYFPPTTKPQKVNFNDYDVDFERRVKLYTLQDTPKTLPPSVDMANEPVATDRPEIRHTVKPSDFNAYTSQSPGTLDKHVYMTNEQRVNEPQNFVINDGSFNRGTYVIKHYKDFLTDAAKEDDDRPADFVPYTEAPARGVTLDELTRTNDKEKTTEADYEYDSQFRKEVLSRFVDNFNQNSDRFKVDFPVLFNTSVVHRSNDDHGRVLASSSTFVKRLYGNELTATRLPQASIALANRGCEPTCENMKVELSPAYELHYYVPEQEEKQVMEQAPATLPYRYKL